MPKAKSKSGSNFPYLVVGIDPGKSGGVAWMTPQRMVTATPAPESEEELTQLVNSIDGLGEELSVEVFCFIEQVSAMPGQGVTSMFSFGQTYGMIRQAYSIFPREFIRPQVWMKGLQIPPREKTESKPRYKERLRVKSRQLFPKLGCWSWGLGAQRSVCDALLIMEYGRRKLLGGIR